MHIGLALCYKVSSTTRTGPIKQLYSASITDRQTRLPGEIASKQRNNDHGYNLCGFVCFIDRPHTQQRKT